MKKYYIANPFPYINHGITNYVNSSLNILRASGLDAYEIINEEKKFNRDDFAKKIEGSCRGNIVEIPDTHGMFPNGSSILDLHVRLHAPILQLEKLNQKKLSKERFFRELSTIKKSGLISSPTLANIFAYHENGLDRDVRVLNFPNPLHIDFDKIKNNKKDIDIVFIARFERLKGIDLFVQFLCHLPKEVKVVLLGVKEENFQYFSKFKFTCELELVGWVTNEVKENYLARSKICLMLSRFESFSMVVAEGLANKCHVVTWNISGAAEAFANSSVKFIKPFDVRILSAAVLDLLSENQPSIEDVKEFFDYNNKKYVEGIKNIVSNSSSTISLSKKVAARAYIPSGRNMKKAVETFVSNFNAYKDLAFSGYSMNSESVENMWGALFHNRLFSDYSIISRHPLGTYRKKGFSKVFEVDESKYSVIDWFRSPELAASKLSDKNFDALIVFNGNTANYRELVSRIYDKYIINPVYTELGWFPQNDNIYFDIEGANAKSSIARSSLVELIGRHYKKDYVRKSFSHGGRLLLALQLPGDTTLMKDSFPMNLSNQQLIEHVRESIPPSIEVVVRKHPMDKNNYSLEGLSKIYFSKKNKFSDDLMCCDALAAVNSTVVLEALSYHLNIYTFGYGVFSNKKLTIDCHEGDLKKKWRDSIDFDNMARKNFIDYLNRRQLNVVDFSKAESIECYSEALYPLLFSIIKNYSEKYLGVRPNKPWGYVKNKSVKISNSFEVRLRKLEIEFEKLINRNNLTSNRSNLFELNVYGSSWKRKFRKLLRNPNLFFKDFIKKYI